MNIESLRNDTPACKELIHLNNAGASLMPKKVADAIHRYIDLESTIGGYEIAEMMKAEIEDFYKVSADFLNCKPENIAYTGSATDSYGRALSSIPFKSGDVILTTDNDYISNFIAFISLKKRFGVELVRVKNTEIGEVDLEDFDQKIKKYSPKLVAVTHIPTNSGLIQPVEEVAGLLKNKEIIYLVDACQSLGQIPVDVQKIGCDFLSGTTRKFMRGPRGAGILYASDKVLDLGLEPTILDMKGATWTAAEEYQSVQTARKFEFYEIPYALLLSSKEAIQYILSIGIENIAQRNQVLCKSRKEKLSEIPHLRLLDKGSKTGSIITFHIPGKSPETIKQKLRDKKINISLGFRGNALIDFSEKGVDWAIRASPHYYNTEDELSRFVEELKLL